MSRQRSTILNGNRVDMAARKQRALATGCPSELLLCNREEASMEQLQRRDFLLSAGTAAGALLLDRYGSVAFAQEAGKVVLGRISPRPCRLQLRQSSRISRSWESLDTWITPNDRFFSIGHYEWPKIDPTRWKLDVDGDVGTPLSLTLDDLKAKPRQRVNYTLECSGNNGLPFFTSGIGNAEWGGTSLADILTAAGSRARPSRSSSLVPIREPRYCVRARRWSSSSLRISRAPCRSKTR